MPIMLWICIHKVIFRENSLEQIDCMTNIHHFFSFQGSLIFIEFFQLAPNVPKYFADHSEQQAPMRLKQEHFRVLLVKRMAVWRHFCRAKQAVPLLCCKGLLKDSYGESNVMKWCIWKVNYKQMCWSVGSHPEVVSRYLEHSSIERQQNVMAAVEVEGLRKSTIIFIPQNPVTKTMCY